MLNPQVTTESPKLERGGGEWKENYKEKRLKLKAISIKGQVKKIQVYKTWLLTICEWGQEPTDYENMLLFIC